MRLDFLGSKVIGFFFLILALGFCLLMEGGTFSQVIQPTIFISVLGVFISGLLLHLGGERTLSYLIYASTGMVMSNQDAGELESCNKSVRSIALGSGGLVMLIILIQMFSNLDDIERLGHGVSVCLTSLIYALVLSFIFSVRLKA